MLHKLHQPLVTDVVKEASNVRIDDPVHLAPANTHKQGIQGLMTPTSRTIAVTEPQKVLFIDTFQYRAHCLLNDLVLQGSHSQRPPPALWLGDVAPLGRLGSVCSAMDSPVQIIDPPLETLRVVSPCLTVDSWRACFFNSKKLARNRSSVRWCSKLMNFCFLALRAASRTPSNP